MKTHFLADPLAKIKPKGDSTLSLLGESLRRGQEAYWATDSDLEYIVDPKRGGRVRIHPFRVEAVTPGGLPRLGSRESLDLEGFSAVFIRKDPPFDAGYVRLCWLLSLAESKVFMMNRPSLLLRYHEKLVPLEALAQGFLRPDDLIPSHLGTLSSAQQFVRELQTDEVITKPFLGFGGNDVQRCKASEFLARRDESGEVEDVLVQPFQEDIVRYGDRRVFFLEGKILAHFVRRPKAGGFISNLAQGGSAVAEPLPAEGREVLERLGRFLAQAGITLAGAVLIGRRISEVNITSPTGQKSLEALEGNDYAAPIMNVAESSAAASTR
jgi:glutathione synthase